VSAVSHGKRGEAEWTRRGERGSASLIRFIAWFSMKAGRTPARLLLYPSVAYFLVAAGDARRASREYLTRCLGRPAALRDVYAHLLAFASTLHDRVFFLRDRFDLFDLEVAGTELFADGGALLMGSHVGSFEVIRACALRAGRRVAMAMYEENARKVQAVLASVNPAFVQEIVPLGRIDSMLVLRERLAQGALVGVLADRSLGHDPAIEVPFLGAPAAFPTGPMRMAAALRQRVILMAGLYLGGNRYAIRFEPLADFTMLEGLTRSERDARVREAVERYAARLEHYCRQAPYNFFNFYPFWRP
jgi:predicted LPLAT superfamily acyltransferase